MITERLEDVIRRDSAPGWRWRWWMVEAESIPTTEDIYELTVGTHWGGFFEHPHSMSPAEMPETKYYGKTPESSRAVIWGSALRELGLDVKVTEHEHRAECDRRRVSKPESVPTPLTREQFWTEVGRVLLR